MPSVDVQLLVWLSATVPAAKVALACCEVCARWAAAVAPAAPTAAATATTIAIQRVLDIVPISSVVFGGNPSS